MTTKREPQRRSYEPLADHPTFAQWRRPQAWEHGSVAFGSVVDDLVQRIRDYADRPRRDSWRYWEKAVAVGCVPWLSSTAVTDALATLDGCCVVIDKGAGDRRAVKQLAEHGSPIYSDYLPGFDELGTVGPDGKAPVMTPSGLLGNAVDELGPVRVAGWRDDKKAPLLHAKLLVLGHAIGWDDDEDDWGVHYRFQPQRVWLGSANWTEGAAGHLEFGVWSDEPALVEHTSKFVLDVVQFSEPLDTTSNAPSPELVDAAVDHDAFVEAMEALRETDADTD